MDRAGVPVIPASPSELELAAAIASGVPVVRGWPVAVRRDNGYAALNLVAAIAGHPDPWWVVARSHGGAVVQVRDDRGDRGMSVAGMAVQPHDWAAPDAATAAAPTDEDRHCPEGQARRERAGRAALRCGDAMVRARLLDLVDGWCAVLGELIDQDPRHGSLHKPSDPDMSCRLLRVTCPSTGRAYVLRVPAEHATAAAARRWVLLDWFGPDGPEVET